MSARLVIRRSDGTLQAFPLATPTTIGSGKDADIVVSRDHVSAAHALIQPDGEGFSIEDLQSAYGTFVNGSRIGKVQLRHFDILTLAPDVTLVFLTTQLGSARVEVMEVTEAPRVADLHTIAGHQPLSPGRLPKFAATIDEPLANLTPPPQPQPQPPLQQAKEASPSAETQAPLPPRKPLAETVTAMPPAAGEAPISAIRLSGPTGTFKTSLGKCMVGRGAEAGVRIDSKEISRRHAEIVIRPDGITIEDLKSANGTRVNGTKISSTTNVKDGDTVAFAVFKFKIEVVRLER